MPTALARNARRCPPSCASRYKPFRSCGDEMTDALVAADLLVGRAGSSTLAEACALGSADGRRAVSARRRSPGAQRASAGRGRRRAHHRRRGLRRRGAARRAAVLSDDRRALDAMRAAARQFGRPGAADAVAELVLALAERRQLPERRPTIGPVGRAQRHDRGRARTHLDETELARLATDIQRRIGVETSRHEPLAPLHDDARGRPGRPVRRGAQPVRAARARPLRAQSRSCPISSSAAARTWSSATPACAAWSSRTAPSRTEFEGTRLTADSGLPMAKAATLGQTGRAVRPRVRPGHPGHRRRCRVGQRRGARVGRPGGSGRGERAARRRHRGDARSRRPRPGLPRKLLKHAAPGAPDVVTWAAFELTPAEPEVITARLDDIRRWRQAHQPLGMPSAGSVFRNPADGPRRARSSTGWA